MIVSASYRTDIPAFYTPWFLNRLAAGFCQVANPYGGAASTVPLGPGVVDAFVFWTRNLKPLLPSLSAVEGRAPFVVQFTLTGYPRPLEAAVIGAAAAIRQIRAVRAQWGPRAAVWRYDPVVISSLTPPSWHRTNFARLSAALAGAVDEVVLSFLEPYRKTRSNLDAAAERHGFAWRDPEPEEKRALIGDLALQAAAAGMTLTLCTQPALASGTAPAARCIDVARLGDLAGRPVAAPEKGNRPGCRCALARDIGAYDSCPHGCVYCYAVARRERAAARYRAHDPTSPFLIAPGHRPARRDRAQTAPPGV